MTPITAPEAALITTAIQALPGIIGLFRQQHAAANPAAPVPTSEQIIAALHSDAVADVLKDDLWLSQHPDPPTVPGA